MTRFLQISLTVNPRVLERFYFASGKLTPFFFMQSEIIAFV